MQKFLNDAKQPYCVVWDLRICGVKTTRIGSSFSKRQKSEAARTGEVPRKSTGRPGQFEYDCSFCKATSGTPGVLKQHYDQVHYQEQQQREQMRKKDKAYYCPVTGCGKTCKSATTMRKHLRDTSIHSIQEMLEQGLPVWHYRKSTKAMVCNTLNWLVEKGYVEHSMPSKRARVSKPCSSGNE